MKNLDYLIEESDNYVMIDEMKYENIPFVDGPVMYSVALIEDL